MASSVRYDWYESPSKLTLDIMSKNIDAEASEVEFKPRSVRLRVGALLLAVFSHPPRVFPSPTTTLDCSVSARLAPRQIEVQLAMKDGSTYLLDIDLAGRIDPNKSSVVYRRVKAEVRLVKATTGEWGQLQGVPGTGQAGRVETRCYALLCADVAVCDAQAQRTPRLRPRRRQQQCLTPWRRTIRFPLRMPPRRIGAPSNASWKRWAACMWLHCSQVFFFFCFVTASWSSRASFAFWS